MKEAAAIKPIKFEILTGINPKDHFDSKHLISYGFTIGERHYFRFDDPLNTPYQRALQVLVYYREYDMNVDRPTLLAYTQALDNLFQKTQLTVDDILDIRSLNLQLKELLALPKETVLMYKLAAVVWFDQHENPEVYEFKYGEKKIMEWQKNIPLKSFFLQQPLMILMPYLQHAGENLEMFSQMTDKVKQKHLDKLFTMLSPIQRTALQSSLKSLLAQ